LAPKLEGPGIHDSIHPIFMHQVIQQHDLVKGYRDMTPSKVAVVTFTVVLSGSRKSPKNRLFFQS